MNKIFTKKKIHEFEEALKLRHSQVIIIYGPSGSGKTLLTNYMLRQHQISAIAIDNLTTYNGRYISTNAIGTCDFDSHVAENVELLRRKTNLIVESRSFFKFDGIFIKLSPIPAGRATHLTGRSMVSPSLEADNFHRLGKLFYKSEKHQIDRIKEYVFGNYLDFFAIKEAHKIAEVMSVIDNEDVLASAVVETSKIRPKVYHSFKFYKFP